MAVQAAKLAVVDEAFEACMSTFTQS
jgi:hypothetical protein